VRVVLDEMYPPALARDLRKRGIDATTASELGLAGSSDPDLLAWAAAHAAALLTENVADFARAASDVLLSGGHHGGVLIALSSRFSRRPSGLQTITEAIVAVSDQDLRDRVVFLELQRGHGEPGETS
jgi:hypothetical protein